MAIIIQVFKTVRDIFGTLAIVGTSGIMLSIAIARIADRLKMLDKKED